MLKINKRDCIVMEEEQMRYHRRHKKQVIEKIAYHNYLFDY
jgi:hypothetical protein